MHDVVADASVILDGNQEEDYFPLYSDTLIQGISIKEINSNTGSVFLQDIRTKTIVEMVNYIRNLLTFHVFNSCI
jgi:hypothetical protein